MFQIPQELAARLTGQLTNPRHCHLVLDGCTLKHGRGSVEEPNPLKGLPIRFTRLAAERLAGEAAKFGRRAEIVAIGEPAPPAK